MYLRWKTTHLSTPAYPLLPGYYPAGLPRQQRFSHRAYLVESARVDGKVRQRVVAYLAAYVDDGFENPHERAQFWVTVLPRLDALDLEPQTRQPLIAQLAERVRPVTDLTAEARAWEARRRADEERYAQWCLRPEAEKQIDWWAWREPGMPSVRPHPAASRAKLTVLPP